MLTSSTFFNQQQESLEMKGSHCDELSSCITTMRLQRLALTSARKKLIGH